MEPRHERIARIALAAGARYGLALAGGYAVAAHGMGNRPTGPLGPHMDKDLRAADQDLGSR